MSAGRVAGRRGSYTPLAGGSGGAAEEPVELRHPSGHLLVWEPARAVVEPLVQNGSLYGWAEAHTDRGAFPGRRSVYTVPAPCAGPERRGRWAVRRYWRGGAMAMHMGDRHLRFGRPRPHREAAAVQAARGRGISTPAVIAGATYTTGAYYRCDLVTEVVPDVETLADALHRHDGTRRWLVSLARAGALLRSLAAVGIHHVDLNAHNILLANDGGAPAWVVDLDRARVLRRGSERARAGMESRLIRSILKVGTPTGERLRHGEIERALGLDPQTA